MNEGGWAARCIYHIFPGLHPNCPQFAGGELTHYNDNIQRTTVKQ